MRARQVRAAGLAASTVAVAVGGAAAVGAGLLPAAVLPWLPVVIVAGPASAALALAGAKAALGDRLDIELHRGRLHLQMLYRNGLFVKPDAIEVPALQGTRASRLEMLRS